MRVLLTALAKEDIAALELIDYAAYQRLHKWLQQLSSQVFKNMDVARLNISVNSQDFHLPIFSWPVSEVHRAVFAKHGEDIVLLQCRFHF